MKQTYLRPVARIIALSGNCHLTAGSSPNASIDSRNAKSGNAAEAASRGGSNWEDDDE